MMPDTEIEKDIDKILKENLSEKDYNKVLDYIDSLLESREAYWESSMGDDL